MRHIKEFPVVITDRLTLREMREDDLEGFFAIFGDQAVLKYYGMRAYATPEKAAGLLKRMINKFTRKQGIRWAITLKGDDRLVGTIGYKNWDTRSQKGEVSYELNPTHWGRGLMTEALKAVIDFGFRNGLNRVEAWDMAGNAASRRVLEKAGLVQEGTWREHTYWNGHFHDIEWFSVLKREWTDD